MPSDELAAITALLGAAKAAPDTPLEDLRVAYAGMGTMVPADAGVTVEPAELGGVGGDWLTPAADDGRVVLYFHGGGYNIGSNESHRSMLTHLAARARARVFATDYRLAPEAPYPAAVDDALAAYRGLLAAGVDPARVVVAGDSAGGGLTLALLVRLRGAGDALPAGAVALSPWVDLAQSGASMDANDTADLMLGRPLLDHWSAAYRAGAPVDAPDISPVGADLTGLPPLLVLVGDTEVLLDDSTRLAERAGAAGVEVTLEVEPGMFHVWPFFAGVVPESDAALDRVAAWVTGRTP